MTIVTSVHKVKARDGTHEHIAEVRSKAGTAYSRVEVVRGLGAGESWKTEGADGVLATIKRLAYCPASGCDLSPYITTAPDHTTNNDLDTLPRY
jgi:hypothetical protein